MDANSYSGFKIIDMISMILLVVGGLNWGLVGFFGFDLVAAVFGEMSILSRIIYALVGFSAAYHGFLWKAIQRRWECKTGFGHTATAGSGS